jgi:hypothetical protein
MKPILLAALSALIASPALAADPDLVQCLWPTGQPIDARTCDGLRGIEATHQAEAQRQASLRAQQQATADATLAQRLDADQAERARVDAINQEGLRRQAAADAARAQGWQEERNREQAYEDRMTADTNARRAACGPEFGKPAVGMTLQRAQQCVGTFRLQGEVVTTGGKVQTYVGHRTVLHVAGGKVASWARY